MISEKIKTLIQESLKTLDFSEVSFIVEHPSDLSHGDYSSNIALALAKQEDLNPKDLAEKITEKISKDLPKEIKKVEVAGPGFINFFLSEEFFVDSLKEILEEGEGFGKNKKLKGEKIIVEYTDPNPFKEFHIGHLMSNSIGEAISRLVEWNGAEVKRACYQGDVGLHVAKAVFARIKNKELGIKSGEWGEYYALGSSAYEDNSEARQEIERLNKKIYEKSDQEINKIYEEGKKISLEEFEKIYQKLGTSFDFNFFESETGKLGLEIVKKNTPGVFEESEGAIVYKGEERDKSLHTRVFINKDGLPTYEAKELGLAPLKYEKYPYTKSIVITGNEVNDYFKVLLSAMKEIFPDLREKTEHISHGMLRLPGGKMSSRTGDVMTAKKLLGDIEKVSREKSPDVSEDTHEKIAVSAIKYSILRQSPGKDVVFDLEKAISLEGDSGPYLLYSVVRASSVLKKAKEEKIEESLKNPEEVQTLEKLLYRFPEIVDKALDEYAPQQIVNYLTTLASAFNSFYAENPIAIKSEDKSPYRVYLTKATKIVLENGLNILGISVPERM